jgi:hypothetical protein
VGRDDHFAGGQVEIHQPDQLDNLRNGVQVADIDEQEFAAAVDKLDIDPQPAAGLVVHLNDVRKKVLPLQHDRES